MFLVTKYGFISVKQELPTLPEYLSSPSVFCWVRVTRSLVLCFVDRCLSFCTFYFGHCVVCPSIYEFWLLPWYLQTLFVYVFLYSSIFILSYEFWYGCRSKKKIILKERCFVVIIKSINWIMDRSWDIWNTVTNQAISDDLYCLSIYGFHTINNADYELVNSFVFIMLFGIFR